MRQVSAVQAQGQHWPILEPLDGGTDHPVALSKAVCVAGSRSRVNLPLSSPMVSRAHALFVNGEDGVYLRDLASANRVYLNESPVREAVLGDGDVIRIGPFSFRCQTGFGRPSMDGVAPPAALRPTTGGSPHVKLDGRTLVIGRRGGCDVRLDEDALEPAHAVIFVRDGRRYLRDLRSHAGTFVNGRPIGMVELSPGDVLRFGQVEFRYEAADAADDQPIDMAHDDTSAADTVADEALADEAAPARAEEPQSSGATSTEDLIPLADDRDELIPVAMDEAGPSIDASSLEERAAEVPAAAGMSMPVAPAEPAPVAPEAERHEEAPIPIEMPLESSQHPDEAAIAPSPLEDELAEAAATESTASVNSVLEPDFEVFPLAHDLARPPAIPHAAGHESQEPTRGHDDVESPPHESAAPPPPGHVDRQVVEEAFTELLEDLSEDVTRIRETWAELKTATDEPHEPNAAQRPPGASAGDARPAGGKEDRPPERRRTTQPGH